jgi:hypothetical protein
MSSPGVAGDRTGFTTGIKWWKGKNDGEKDKRYGSVARKELAAGRRRST